MCRLWRVFASASSFRQDEAGVSPVIGTILLVALSTVVVTTGAAVSTGVVELPEPAPSGDMVVSDAPGTLSGSADSLFWLKHRGGDPLVIDDLELVVKDGDGNVLYHREGQLELSELGVDDGVWDMGETLVVSEVECTEISGDHDKGHGNDEDGYDEDNPGKSTGTKGKKKGDDKGKGKAKGKDKHSSSSAACWPDFSDDDQLHFEVYHVPTGDLIMEGGVNVE